jgi:hypothetical protein
MIAQLFADLQSCGSCHFNDQSPAEGLQMFTACLGINLNDLDENKDIF